MRVAKIKHGHSISHLGKASPTYLSWINMKQRCTNKNHEAYSHYGGAGITYTEHWEKFENFLEDMGERPEGKSIDRIDGEKGYSKENCKWSTSKEQARNKKTNVVIELDGKKVKLIEFADKNGLNIDTLRRRKKSGWDIDDVLSGNHHIKTAEFNQGEKHSEGKKKLMELFKRSAKIVATYLSVLSPKEKKIIERRFGLTTGKRMTLEEVGKEYGVTRERVRQIESVATKKMLDFYYNLSS